MQPTPHPGLEILVLGPLDIRVDGVPLVADTRKALAILALLAVERRAYARDELAAMFWPEADDDDARGSLRRTLSTLRSGLGDRWLVVDRSQVGLDRDGAWIDLAEVERRLSGGGIKARETDVADLASAAALVRGPFLAGFNLRDSPAFDDWRATRASAIERLVGEVLERLAMLRAHSGDLPGAVEVASRRVALDPLDEAAHRRLMRYLAEAGDRGAAIRQYRSCVVILERELGVQPLAETTELYEAIRDGAYQPSTGPMGAGPIDATLLTSAGADGPESASKPAIDAATALPFVGRDRELAAIMVTYRASTVDGHLVVIEGEAGIGKTRLGEEAAARVAAQGGIILAARAYAAEAGIAYAPVVELLHRGMALPGAGGRLSGLADEVLSEVSRLIALPPGVGLRRIGQASAPYDPLVARGRLLEALSVTLAALVAGPAPGLLHVDDCHWADASTLEMLGYLVRRLAGRPMLVLLTWRPEDLDDRALAFAGLVESLPGTLALPLQRLDRTDVAELVAASTRARPPADVASFVDRLVEQSEGLPLYLVERLAGDPRDSDAGDAATVPHGVRALLRERLGRVGETGAQVLSAGAVIGRSFDLATLRAASGRSEDEAVGALEELLRRGLIHESEVAGDVRYDFAHASLREVAYEATSLARRRLLHGRVADAMRLRSDPPGGADLARLVLIAQHERAAGRENEAADRFRVAGERARALFANREAVDLLETALALGHPDVGGLHLALGELRIGLGDYAAAVASLETAAALADAERLPEVELRLGRVHARRGDLVSAASHLDSALGQTGAASALSAGTVSPSTPEPGPRLRARILVERSVVALRSGDPGAASRFADEALAIATRLADRPAAGMARRIRGLVARSRGDLRLARAELEESLVLSGADPDPGAAIAAANALALVETAAGDRDGAIRHLEAAVADARRTGERHLEAAIENNLADLYHGAEDPEASMAHLKRAVALFAEIGGRPGELEPEIWKLETW